MESSKLDQNFVSGSIRKCTKFDTNNYGSGQNNVRGSYEREILIGRYGRLLNALFKFRFRIYDKNGQLILTIQCDTMRNDRHTFLFRNSAPKPGRHLYRNMISVTCQMRDFVGKGIIKLLDGIF